jgi:hypothetical protein
MGSEPAEVAELTGQDHSEGTKSQRNGETVMISVRSRYSVPPL